MCEESDRSLCGNPDLILQVGGAPPIRVVRVTTDAFACCTTRETVNMKLCIGVCENWRDQTFAKRERGVESP